jgi:preprotein translocase subunit YajC
LISSLHANAEDLSNIQGASSQILMLVIFIAIFYFLIWRPQSKKNEEHKKLIDNLSTGDEILTSGGILGKIVKVDKNFIDLEVSNNMSIKVQKHSIIKAYPKGTISSIN